MSEKKDLLFHFDFEIMLTTQRRLETRRNEEKSVR